MNANSETPPLGGNDAGKSEPSRSPIFATTHWSVVLAAANRQSPEAAVALERLCKTYWYPLYAYIRRRGYSAQDAEDLTQSFFAHLLERHALHRVSPAKGKFRSFMLASLNYFLADQFDRNSAQKRGGGQTLISFEVHDAEDRFRFEPMDVCSPDKIFERRWALTLLDRVLALLKDEFAEAGKSVRFDRLSIYLVSKSGESSYAEAARELGQTEHAVKKAIQRMRQRFYELFREEVANTVATQAEVEEELQYLCQVIAAD